MSYGVDLIGDDLAHRSVAARCGLDKLAVVVQNVERKPVKFVLASKFWKISHRLDKAVAPLGKLFFGLALVKAVKAQKVRRLFKFAFRRAAHSVRGTVFERISFFRFESAQLVIELVIFGIRNDGSVFFIIQSCPLVESVNQFFHS